MFRSRCGEFQSNDQRRYAIVDGQRQMEDLRGNSSHFDPGERIFGPYLQTVSTMTLDPDCEPWPTPDGPARTHSPAMAFGCSAVILRANSLLCWRRRSHAGRKACPKRRLQLRRSISAAGSGGQPHFIQGAVADRGMTCRFTMSPQKRRDPWRWRSRTGSKRS